MLLGLTALKIWSQVDLFQYAQEQAASSKQQAE